ncbi:MAG: hypothetical protein K6A38_07295 [Lachnospiraceae bacterium]|nr:hypothetical protein [Lachnospiraceae bacterium]
MKINNSPDDYENKDKDLYEDDLFEEDGKKVYVIRIIIVACVILIGIAVIFCLMFFKKPKDKASSDLQENITDYTKNEDALSTPEPLPSPEEEEAYATPLPTPGEEAPLESSDEEDDNAFAVHGETMQKGTKDYTKVKFDTKRNLQEMESYFEVNNNEAISDLAHLDRYIAMSYSLTKTSEDSYYYGDLNASGKPHGKGIAVYEDNMYYYGDWVNGKRDGAGKWVHFHIHDGDDVKDKLTYHEYQGTFKRDLPNGPGQDHYEYDLSMLKENKNYVTNYICDFSDGLITGEIYCTTTDKNGGYKDWEGTAENGQFEYISASRDSNRRGPVMTNRENPDEYMWINDAENMEIGVTSYYSAYK